MSLYLFLSLSISLSLVCPRQPTLTADNHGKATLINSRVVFNCSSHYVGAVRNLTFELMLNGTSSAVSVNAQNPSTQGLFTVQTSSLSSSGTYECVALINDVRSIPSNPVTVRVVGKMLLYSAATNILI